MKRLTKKVDGSVVFPAELVGVTLTPDNEYIHAVLQQLAAYEDTGLTPEEVLTMRCEMEELPVKPGDKVYFLLQDFPTEHPETNGWYITKERVLAVSLNGFYSGNLRINDFIPYAEVGDEVFLTREAASDALKKKVQE